MSSSEDAMWDDIYEAKRKGLSHPYKEDKEESIVENIYDFQVGDKVWSPLFSYNTIEEILKDNKYPIKVQTKEDYFGFTYTGSYLSDAYNKPLLFHAEAVTLDNEERLLFVDYDYRPKRNVSRNCKFKPKDWVLVRDSDSQAWKLDIFSHTKENEIYICVCSYYTRCIPYEGNEHLLGTTDEE